MEPYLCALALAICASVSASSDGFFFFNAWFRRADSQENCKMCYGENDCLSLNQARCELYTATTAVLADEEEPQDPGQPTLTSQVDELMATMVERATSSGARECIPFISKYTDCTKDNACLGCVSCACDERARWRCSSEQHCRREEPYNIDHRALVYAIENLRGDGNPSFRLKRSASTQAPVNKLNGISFDEISEWMFEVKPLNVDHDEVNATTEASNNNNKTAKPGYDFESMIDDATDPATITESDYIAFNDVLINIGVEVKNNSDNKDTPFDHDYMNLEDINVTYNKAPVDRSNDHQKSKPRKVNVTSATTAEAITTPRELDLLELAKRKYAMYSSKNKTGFSLYSMKNDEFENIAKYDNYTAYDDYSNDIDRWNAVNIMKRDVSNVSSPQDEVPAVTTKSVDDNVIQELDDEVYQPLNKVIEDKMKELEDLLKIRKNLIDILKLNKTKDVLVLFNKSYTSDRNNDSHYSFYNVEILPKLEYAFKRSNNNELDKYLKILRHDIYTVMRDISIIQKFTGRHNVPDEIKTLIRAMKHYVHKQGKLHTHSHGDDDLRRWSGSYLGKDIVKQFLIDILHVIDKDMPSTNALAPLSTNSKKVIKRIMKSNKMEDFSALGLRVNDRNYNLTNDLKTIGTKWPVMTAKVANSSPWDKLFNMKMLQIILETDIYKMNDALALIDFAHSRRMVTLDDDVSDSELLRINTSLRSIHNKIKKIIQLKNTNKKNEVKKVVNLFTVKQNKKQTFLKHIRDLLKTSKGDITNLLRKKVPKTEIIKGLAKKKLDEITKNKLKEYENVMYKWQNNLDVHKRRKRSPEVPKLLNNIKNILPKYLRGKVNPKINARNKTKSKNLNVLSKRNWKSHRKQNRRKNSTKRTTQLPQKENS